MNVEDLAGVERLSARIFDAESIEPDAGSTQRLSPYVPLLNRWIQQDLLPYEVPIDVAGYEHVPSGPGILLICHSGHYAIDDREQQIALRYELKRNLGKTWAEKVAMVFRATLSAARLLEAETVDSGSALSFDTRRLVVRIHDRLHAPNSKASHEMIDPHLLLAAESLYGGAALSVRAVDDDDLRQPFTSEIAPAEPDKAPSIATLLARAEELVHA